MPPPLPSSALSDSQLAAFREKAGPVLAEARGITSHSLAKLGEIARDIGLADDQIQAAIRSLHAGPARPKDPVVLKFHKRLLKDLSVKKKAIIGPEIEARIIAGGIEKYSLSEPVILEVLADVAAELGLRRITGDEAVTHFIEMVNAAIGESTWLARQSWDRLRLASEKWGLTFEDADELIEQKLDANRHASSRGRLLSGAVMYGAIGVVICALVVLGILVMRRKDEALTTIPPDSSIPSIGPGETRPTTVRGPPAWWGADLAVPIATAKREIPGISVIYNRLISEVPSQRGAAYAELVGLGAKAAPGSAPRISIAEILAGLHALEPDEEAAGAVRIALLALIPSHTTALTPGTSLYERAFWGTGVARAALHWPGIREERQAGLATALSGTLGIFVGKEIDDEELKTKCEAALSSLLFQHLISAAGKHPASAPVLHQYLLEHGRLPATAEEMEPLEASYLAALLPATEVTWHDQQELLTRLVRSKNPVVTLRMADLLTRVSDRGLQSLLTEELVKHTGAKPRTSDPRDVARAVRQALGAAGVNSAQSQEDRWELLRLEARGALAAKSPRDDDYAALLKETVELARLATLAVALSQGDSGVPVFDELLAPQKPAEPMAEKEGPEDSPQTAVARPRPLSNREKQQLEQYIASMRAWHEQLPIARTGSLRQLAIVAPVVADLSYEQGAAVAHYLLGEKSQAEQQSIQPVVAAMKRWKQLRLAVADQIEESKLPPEQKQELTHSLLEDGAVILSTESAMLRRSLLLSVQSELGSGKNSSGSADGASVQQTAQQLAEYYRTRARLTGVSAADLAAAHSPGQVLEVLVQAMTKSGSGSKKAMGSGSAGFAERLEVARFLGTSDLRKAVLLQRLSLEGAVERISLLRPRQAEAATLVLAELEAADVKAANLLVQLYQGEAATLKLGMLYGTN